MQSLFTDGEEYLRRKSTPFKPTKLTIGEIRAAVPKELHVKNTFKGLLYVARAVVIAALAFQFGRHIETITTFVGGSFGLHSGTVAVLRWSLWSFYWFGQSVVLAGWWCLAHEAGHGTISSYGVVNHVVGFTLHTALLVPYYAWRSTHHAHHKASVSVERDEHYVPRERSKFGLRPKEEAVAADYHEIFEEMPLFSLLRLIAMQLLGWQAYLLTNITGSPRYPPGTNHFSPSSPLFRDRERNDIIASNIGLGITAAILFHWTQVVGFGAFVKLYLIPYLLTNHWIVMLTFLHHSDPTIPYYRKGEWTFLRGALATVDRPLLGWAGRFFLFNVSHDHIAHHIFSSTPFYNQPQVTEHLKKVLGDDYNYDSTNTLRALYRSFTECCFIEDEGDIVFYANGEGKTARSAAT